MTDEAPVQAPTNIEGVGIHLSYLRKDMKEMKDTLSNITSNYVPITIFLELKSAVAHLETENEKRKEFQDTLTGKIWGISMIAGLVVSILTIVVNHFWK